jgi:hypothetical protein
MGYSIGALDEGVWTDLPLLLTDLDDPPTFEDIEEYVRGGDMAF